MIAAIYCRKSNRDADAKSVTEQIAECTRYAASKGWTIDDRYVFIDDGVSGALLSRPGLDRLLAAVKQKPPFGVLLIWRHDRLGRPDDMDDPFAGMKFMTAVYAPIVDAHVEIWDVVGNRQIGKEVLIDFVNVYSAGQHRKSVRQDVTRSGRNRFQSGKRIGRLAYGLRYGKTGEVEIFEPEARYVRRIFAEYARRVGIKTIANRLNDENVPNPSERGKWWPSQIAHMLRNRSYSGVQIWSSCQRIVQAGRLKRVATPEREITRPIPRVVPAGIWNTVQRLLKHTRSGRGGRSGSRFLLTPYLKCGLCGSGMRAQRNRQAHWYFLCSRRGNLGRHGCSSAKTLRMDRAERMVLAALYDNLFHHEFVDSIERTLTRQRQTVGDRKVIEKELKATETKIAGLEAALAEPGGSSATRTGIKQRLDHEHTRLERLKADVATAGMTSAERKRALAALHVELGAINNRWRAEIAKSTILPNGKRERTLKPDEALPQVNRERAAAVLAKFIPPKGITLLPQSARGHWRAKVTINSIIDELEPGGPLDMQLRALFSNGQGFSGNNRGAA